MKLGKYILRVMAQGRVAALSRASGMATRSGAIKSRNAPRSGAHALNIYIS